MDYNEAFGSVFRSVRLHRGLTQEAFQPAATERYIRNIEKGEYSASIALVRDLCAKLGISPIALMAMAEAKYAERNPEDLIKIATTEIRDINKKNST
ncbi:helix-turn-helix domain-containing protein [Pseudomonas sp. Irchel 3F3]|uniref:helix-turn-helix domain-containing protein n=1 Tax=Pseudomonas sp. Irchel 3F3 TaxID=2009000 RepID=UPI000BA3E3DD|nr:helix-turn-helix domain-containing protein [Pseudomonas sp. Irchel 3F3]